MGKPIFCSVVYGDINEGNLIGQGILYKPSGNLEDDAWPVPAHAKMATFDDE